MTTEPNFTKETSSVNLKDDDFFNLGMLKDFFFKALRYYKLFLLFLVIFTGIGVFYCATSKPVFTAIAMISPPAPSPTTSMLSGMGAPVIGAKKLFGGSGGNDPYQEYIALLKSTRLCHVLVERGDLLPTLFPERWDSENKSWRVTNSPIKNFVKGIFHTPVKSSPDADDLKQFLDARLSISEVSASGSSPTLSSATYTSVSFRYGDRQEAERLLNLILRETDNLIREDQRQDIAARISVLKSELLNTTQSEERAALINVLSDQEQLYSIIKADKRYATSLIIPPYASAYPDWPPGAKKLLTYVFAVSMLFWFVIVASSMYFTSIEKYLRPFASNMRILGKRNPEP